MQETKNYLQHFLSPFPPFVESYQFGSFLVSNPLFFFSLQELIKQSVGGKEENKDTDNLVQETDSQYGTWETGLHTDDR